jgi:hypothetical protein
MVKDVFVATTGSYNLSFLYEDHEIKQRIDSDYELSRKFSFGATPLVLLMTTSILALRST